MNQDNSNNSSKPPINFPPLPIKYQQISRNSLSNLPMPGNLHPQTPGYSSELSFNLFPSREVPNFRNKPAFPPHQKFYLANNFLHNENLPHLNQILEVNNDSVSKNKNLNSTRENFSKTTNKLHQERQNSFDKLQNSSHSQFVNSFSYPNLEDLVPLQPNKASFMDLKGTSPVNSHKNLQTPLLLNPQYQPIPSLSCIIRNPSMKDFQTLQVQNSKRDLFPYFDKKNFDNSFVNMEYTSPNLINNVSSINNLDTFQVKFSSKKNDMSDKLLNFAFPNNQKSTLNGKFPTMRAFESKDLEPSLGKREFQLKSKINLPSLKRQIKNPSTGQLDLSKGIPSIKVIKEDNEVGLQNKPNQEKPNSTTSLESKIVMKLLNFWINENILGYLSQVV